MQCFKQLHSKQTRAMVYVEKRKEQLPNGFFVP